MDSSQDLKKAEKRIKELQDRPELDAALQDKLDNLITEVNEFKEKTINFE